MLSAILILTVFAFDLYAISSDLIEVKPESGLYIDRINGYICGVLPETTYGDFLECFENQVILYKEDGSTPEKDVYVATGDVIATIDESDALIVLIYGDVYSDGVVDGTDALMIEMLLSEQLYDYELDLVCYHAAVFSDRLDGLSKADVEACFNSGLMSDEIPQFIKPDLPEDKSELLEIFNSTINSVKSGRPGVKTVRISEIPSVTGVGYVSQQIANSIKGKTNSSEEVFQRGESHDDAIPIAKKTWSSALTLEDVKYITPTDNGDGTFSITVTMPDESYDALKTKPSQTIHGKIIDACEFVPEAGQEDWYSSVVASYSGVTVKCTYNCYTGEFLSAEYYIPYRVTMLGELNILITSYPIDVTVDYIQTIEVTKT